MHHMASTTRRTPTLTDRRHLHHSAVGRHITTKIPKLHLEDRVIDAFHFLQKRAAKLDSLTYLYIIDAENRLKGVISISELLQAAPDQELQQIMQKQLVTVGPELDKELAAQVALQHQLKALPVVEKSGQLLGILQNDELLAILHQEHREDLLRFSGIIPSAAVSASVEQTNVLHSIGSRLPWILIGLVGGVVIAQVIGVFEEVLQKEALLITFIPLIVYIANAVGVQSQMLYIRDTVISERVHIWAFLRRQLLEVTSIGLISWVLLIGASTLLWGRPYLGVIVGLAMVAAIIVATIQSVLIPRILMALKQDPAIGSGPLATILQDMTSVLIYLAIVHALL